jgi:hypothetical protein
VDSDTGPRRRGPLDELRVPGELPGLPAMRLQPKRAPDPRHRRLRETALSRHRARRPVRRVPRRRLQRLDDHLLDPRIGNRPPPARPRLVQQPLSPILREPRAPLPHRRVIHRQTLGDLRVLQPIGRPEHDPGTQRQRLSALATPRPRVQLLPLRCTENYLNRYRTRHPPNLEPAPNELMTQKALAALWGSVSIRGLGRRAGAVAGGQSAGSGDRAALAD